jgi:hypothetical protein
VETWERDCCSSRTSRERDSRGAIGADEAVEVGVRRFEDRVEASGLMHGS